MLGDKPYTERPDLSWATWRDLWQALYMKPYPEAEFGYVTKWTRNPEWDAWSRNWMAHAQTAAETGTPLRAPSPPHFREEVEVELYWVQVELDERREANLQRSLTEIKKASTRELLFWLQRARACGGWWSPIDKNCEYGHKFDDIKNELDTREHIPNKKEAKAQRRAAALRHRKNKLRGPVAHW